MTYLTFGFIAQEAVDLSNGPVESADLEAVVRYIQNQVLAHDSQTNESEISAGRSPRGSADVNAGETAANVSKKDRSEQFDVIQRHEY